VRCAQSLRVLSLAVVALLGAACSGGTALSTSSRPASSRPTTGTSAPKEPPLTIAVDVSATPAGWVPVAYRDAEVSVPANWWVLDDEPPCPVGHPPGELFVNPRPGVYHCPPTTAPGPTTVLTLRSLTAPVPRHHLQVVTVNGLAVIPIGASLHISAYLVPMLGVGIYRWAGDVGTAAIVNTLTRSPRDIALAPGPATTVPKSWHRFSFAGVSVAAPDTWPVVRTDDAYYDACVQGTGVLPAPASVVLDTDRSRIAPFCPFFPFAGPAYRPTDGVRVNEVLLPTPQSPPDFMSCLHLSGLTACPDVSSTEYAILTLEVTGPGLAKPAYVSIGLAGNGLVARTVLDSIRAA